MAATSRPTSVVGEAVEAQSGQLTRLQQYLQASELECDVTVQDIQSFAKDATWSQCQAAQLVLTASLLTKLKQTEKAAHFAERRQDADASLPSELDRHVAGHRQNVAAAVLSGHAERVEQIRKEWRQDRRDATWRGFQTGCLCGLLRAAWLHSIRI